jgi:hypothetical protein
VDTYKSFITVYCLAYILWVWKWIMLIILNKSIYLAILSVTNTYLHRLSTVWIILCSGGYEAYSVMGCRSV